MLKIIGAGYPRTGTMSMQAALVFWSSIIASADAQLNG